ncbi:hypothetical protein quinque_005483 [Culex quinquefasciatus]
MAQVQGALNVNVGAEAPTGPVQHFLIVGGLFSQLHNYCVDQVMTCGQDDLLENAVEKCRALTIGVYQRIIYEELLPILFGSSFYEAM